MKRFLVLVLSLSILCLPMEARRRWVPKIAAAASTTFVTGQTLGTDTTGNNGYELGMQIDVQGASITVTHISFYVISGSTGTHTGNIYSDPFGTPVSVASVSLNFTGLSGWQHVALGSSVVLSASTTYALSGNFVVSTDHTYNNDTTLTHTAVANVPNSLYRPGAAGTFGVSGSTDNCYVPMGFKYQ